MKTLFLLWLSHLILDFFTGIWPIYKTIAGIDIVQAGLIAGLSGFIGEFLQLFFGYFSDKGYRKQILILGLALSSAIVWITFAESLFPSFLLLLLLMIGSGSYHPAAAGIAGGMTQSYKGRFILFYASGGAIGLGISQLIFTHVFQLFDGHVLILLVPVIATLLILLFHRFPEPIEARPRITIPSLIALFRQHRKSLLFLYFSQAFGQGLVLAFTFLLPDLLSDRACHPWLCRGGGHFCFILGAAVTMVPAGYLCDRFGQKKTLLVIVSAATALLYTFLMQRELPLGNTIILLSTLGAFLGIINPIIISWGNRLVPESPSSVSALLMGCAWCLSHLGPTCAGLIVPHFSEDRFILTLALMGLVLALIFFFILLIPSPKRVQIKVGLS